MNLKALTSLLIIGVFSGSFFLKAQTADSSAFKTQINAAQLYDKAMLYAEEAEAYEKAIALAKKNNWEEVYINTSISLAELMRKTRDFEIGKDILYRLPNTEKYPRLHLRKLGRMAALYHETEDLSNLTLENINDSIQRYLLEAIELAVTRNYKSEEASLNNELGYFISQTTDRSEGIKILEKSCEYYFGEQDTANFIMAAMHVLENYIFLENYKSADSLRQKLLGMVAVKELPYIEVDLYALLSGFSEKEGDSVNYFKYGLMSEKARAEVVDIINGNRLNALRTTFETEKYLQRAESSEEALLKISKLNKSLFITMGVLALFFVGIIFLLFREHKLKSRVDKANSKFQMLLVESNHRIKNNLQMIISMLEYANRGQSNKKDIKAMKGKIYTISALHKHLSSEVHNQQVNLSKYFKDVIHIYQNISNGKLQVQEDIAHIEISSERIIYFGLILNEMLSNTIEHHFEHPEAQIKIVKKGEAKCAFTYVDGQWANSDTQKGTGVKLIGELVKRIEGENFILNTDLGKYYFEFYV